MSKVESYLSQRLEKLNNEQIRINDDIEMSLIEINEMDLLKAEISKSLDDTFEVFSPRRKKSDFVKSELDTLEKKKKEKYEFISKSREDLVEIQEEINQLREVVDELNETKTTLVKDSKDFKIYGLDSLKRQELEQERIARDLHDSIVQTLTSFVHKCEICSKIIDVDATRAKLELEIMSKSIRETINEIRNIIYNLRPMFFDDLGLEVTIEKILDITKSVNSSVIMDFESKGKKRELSPVIGITIIRIIQEATSNCMKHSKAKKIEVILEYKEDFFELQIIDNGIGIQEQIISEEKNGVTGFGIQMMKERVYIMSGEIDIVSKKDEGTKVIIRIPYSA